MTVIAQTLGPGTPEEWEAAARRKAFEAWDTRAENEESESLRTENAALKDQLTTAQQKVKELEAQNRHDDEADTDCRNLLAEESDDLRNQLTAAIGSIPRLEASLAAAETKIERMRERMAEARKLLRESGAAEREYVVYAVLSDEEPKP